MQRPDLHGYYLINRGLRQEFGKLSLAARTIRSDQHRQLVEEQLHLVAQVLDLQKVEQDKWLIPALREQDPDAMPGLEAIEGDHYEIRSLLSVVRDKSKSLESRAPGLQTLHKLMNDHIDREERDMVPVIVAHISKAEWRRSSKSLLNGIPSDQIPTFWEWLITATPEEDRQAALRALPLNVRFLHRISWAAAYQERLRALYA